MEKAARNREGGVGTGGASLVKVWRLPNPTRRFHPVIL